MVKKSLKLPEIDLKALLAAGCHFGHRISKTHPKIRAYLYTARDGIQVFDLVQTAKALEKANKFLADLSSQGKKIIFVGTKRQAKSIIRQTAQELGMPFVNVRWLGGFLTNWPQMKKRIKLLKSLSKKVEKGAFERRTKKEQSLLRKQLADFKEKFGGLADLDELPAALFVVDVIKEKISVTEARFLGIPVVAIIDSNADPGLVDYPIPANDDARKSIELITKVIGEGVRAGKQLEVKEKKEKRK